MASQMLITVLALQVAANPLGEMLKMEWGISRSVLTERLGPALYLDKRRYREMEGLTYGGSTDLALNGTTVKLSFFFTPTSDRMAAAVLNLTPNSVCKNLLTEFKANLGDGVDVSDRRFPIRRFQFNDIKNQGKTELMYIGEIETTETCTVIMKPMFGLNNLRK